MALREKLVGRTQPYLEPGEQIHAVLTAQSGPSPYWIILTWLTVLWNKYLIVVVTDRAIVTFRATVWKPTFVKDPSSITRYQLRTLGPCSGLWGKIDLDGQTFHVHKRFHKDIAAADAHVAALGGAVPAPGAAAVAQPEVQAVASAPAATPAAESGPAAGWYPDPTGKAAQRYWDGTTWTEHTA